MDTTPNPGRRMWWVVVAGGGTFAVILLDETIVGVALPTIQRELHMTDSGAHWVVNAYMLTLACLAAVPGKLSDLFGMRTFFTIGISLFAAASLAGGFAQDGTWLLAARALQGAGAAILLPSTLAMVAMAVPKEKQGTAFGLQSAIGATAFALGPLLGGVFTENATWRWIFWINPILCAVLIALIWYAWQEPPKERKRPHLDFAGAVLLAGGVGLLVFGTMQGPAWGWSKPEVWAPLATAVVLLVVFVVVESRVKEPLIDFELFSSWGFNAGNVTIFFAQFSKLAVVVFVALYFQDVLKMKPLAAGVALLPAAVPAPFAPLFAGKMTDKFGIRLPSVAGLAVQTLSLLWLGWAATKGRYDLMAVGLAFWGVSIPVLWTGPLRATLGAVPPDKTGQSGGITATARLLGGTLSVAVCSVLVRATHSYSLLYYVAAGLGAGVFVIAWRWLGKSGG